MLITTLQRPGDMSPSNFVATLAEELTSLKGKLSASTNFAGFSKRGWATVDVAGEDSELVSELIARKLGLARLTLSEIELFANYEGLVNESSDHFEVDVGVEKPKPLNVRVKLSTLQAQLCDGNPLPMEEITKHYCLYPNCKVAIRITHLDPVRGFIEGWLADSQIALFSNWIATRSDRILLFDCSQHELRHAIQKAQLQRDIILIEPMTLTTHAVLCKFGTDAIGLIPKLGMILRKHKLQPFIPKRILTRCRQS